MFSKPATPQNAANPQSGPPQSSEEGSLAARRPTSQKAASLIASDMTIEGNVSCGGELQIDGQVKGDVRVERVTVGDGGQVEGGIFAEAVEVRGRVAGSITAKQVRLYGACHVDGDISHEQLAMETGAFFQGRSLRLQRSQAAVQPPQHPPRSSEPAQANAAPAKDSGNGVAAKAEPRA
ncbi:MAG: bactofilin family protein [Caulobacteraceae bacterium]